MGNETGNGLSGMRLDRRSEKKLSRMGKGMDYILFGMRMGRKREKELSKMGNKMDYGLYGMRMDRRN